MKRWMWIGLAVLVLSACLRAVNDPSAPQAPAPSPPAVNAADNRLAAEIWEHFRQNFGQTTWGSSVTSLTVAGTSLEAKTAIYPDDEGKRFGEQICNAIRGNYRARFAPRDISVRVMSNQATILARCSTL